MKTLFSLLLVGVGGYAVYKYFEARKKLGATSAAAINATAAAQAADSQGTLSVADLTATPQSPQQLDAGMFDNYFSTLDAGYSPAFGPDENQNGAAAGLTPAGAGSGLLL